MENNKQNNNQKSSVRKKANILMLSGTLLFLIVGITIGGLMFRNSNLNKTNIQTLEKQLLSLKKLKGPKGEDGLTGPAGPEGNPGRNGNEITNLELLAKIKTLDFNDETLKSKLVNVVKNELNNQPATEAFNKLFKETDKYKQVFNAYKTGKFIKTKTYKDALSVWIKNTKNEQLKTAFIKTKTYKDLLKNHNQNQQLATEFKETLEHTTLSNPYKDAFKAYKVIKFEDTKTYANEFNAYKATKKAELETEFKGTKKYTDALDAFKVKEFYTTNEYKNAFSEYLFSFKGKLEALETENKALKNFIMELTPNKLKAIKWAQLNNGKKTLEKKGKTPAEDWTAKKMLKFSLSEYLFGNKKWKESEATKLLNWLLENGYELENTKTDDGKKDTIIIKKI